MNRREFSRLVGMSVLAASSGIQLAPGPVLAAAKPGRVDRMHRKEWAREHFKGFENILMPSFTPDMKQLDEEGIRLDVRKSIEHGFFSALAAGIALTPEEQRRFLEIAVDEAGDKMSIAIAGSGPMDDEAEQDRFLSYAEEIGCSHMIAGFSPEGSQDDLYRRIAKLSEKTNMGIYLWMAQFMNLKRFHPSKIPFEAMDKIADLPNVVAVKVGDMDPATLFELFDRYNDRMLIGALWLNIMPMAIKAYGEQWSGAWTVEALQSPEKRWATDFFNLMMAGNYDAGMKLYWKYLAPAFGSMMRTMGPMMASGGHPWEVLKYYQFAVGGNGGQMRTDPHQPKLPKVTADVMNPINDMYRSIDIQPTDLPLEAFQVGRVNWQAGKRT